MLHASTSPFYPLFAALDVNAKIHEGESGRRLWAECVVQGIEARKAIIASCKMIQPFIPPVVAGRPWQDYPTETIARERRFFSFEPGARWHGFDGYASEQYFVDPCKLLLTTPGIDAESGEYTGFGIPATILAHYLRENGIVPEKCDLNSILFLLTPAESAEKWPAWWRCWRSLNSISKPTRRWPTYCRLSITNIRFAIAITPSASCARRCMICMSALT
jgi:ornithine decarboxylase